MANQNNVLEATGYITEGAITQLFNCFLDALDGYVSNDPRRKSILATAHYTHETMDLFQLEALRNLVRLLMLAHGYLNEQGYYIRPTNNSAQTMSQQKQSSSESTSALVAGATANSNSAAVPQN